VPSNTASFPAPSLFLILALLASASASASRTAIAQPAAFASPAPDAPDAPRPPEPIAGAAEAVIEKVTFDGALERALAKNPTAREAQEEVDRYHALMNEVRAASLPTLTGVASYTRLDHDRVSGTAVVQPAGQLTANVTLSVPLIAPKSWVQWQQAGDRVDVARADAAAVRRTVAVSTARAYLSIITQKRLVETARAARDNAKAHYEFTRAQRIGGVGNKLDEARAAQEFTTDEVNLQGQEVALVRAREALGVFVATDGPVDAAGEWAPSPMPSLSDAMNEAATVRPDVRAGERAEKAAERTVHQAWADYLPYLNLIADPFLADPPTPTLPRTGWQAELVLTLPIYDGGLRYGQESERKALANEAKLSVEATLRQARSDVRVAFDEIQRADVALDQAQQSAAFARRALELANIAYKAGATTNLEVVDAERHARDAENQAAIAEDAARQARLDLLAASGRFPDRR
jgi:outer membrane protein TolC